MNSPTLPPSVRDLLVERLDALLHDCDQVMDNADYGQTLYFVGTSVIVFPVLKNKGHH